MKKFLNLLLVLALLVVLPFGVDAATKYTDVYDSNKTPVSGANTETRQYNFYIKVLEGTVAADQEIVVEFTVGSAITDFTCGEIEGGEATLSKEGDNTFTCTYKTKKALETSDDKQLIGTWTIKVKKDAASADCSVNYKFEGNTQTINPETGSSISYVVVGLGVLAAAAAFAVSKKKSKLYNL